MACSLCFAFGASVVLNVVLFGLLWFRCGQPSGVGDLFKRRSLMLGSPRKRKEE